MHRLVAAFAVLAAPAALAQTGPSPQGTVRYEVRAQVQVRELPPELEHRRAEFEADNLSQTVMAFHDTQTLTRDYDPASHQASGEELNRALGGGGRLGQTTFQTATTAFVDADRGVRVTQLQQLGQTFLIEEPVPAHPWRLTGQTSTFLGYEVHQATAETAGGFVEAWFAPAIPASVGPDGLTGLPGLVLLATFDGGRRTVSAKEVDLSPLAVPPAAPTEGRRVTREEFVRASNDQIENLKRMAQQMGMEVNIIRNN